MKRHWILAALVLVLVLVLVSVTFGSVLFLRESYTPSSPADRETALAISGLLLDRLNSSASICWVGDLERFHEKQTLNYTGFLDRLKLRWNFIRVNETATERNSHDCQATAGTLLVRFPFQPTDQLSKNSRALVEKLTSDLVSETGAGTAFRKLPTFFNFSDGTKYFVYERKAEQK